MPRDQRRVVRRGPPHHEVRAALTRHPRSARSRSCHRWRRARPASCRAPHDRPVVLHHHRLRREPEMRQQARQVETGRHRAPVAVDGDLDVAHAPPTAPASAATACAGSLAPQIARIAATPYAPVACTSAARSGVTPPIAITRGPARHDFADEPGALWRVSGVRRARVRGAGDEVVGTLARRDPRLVHAVHRAPDPAVAGTRAAHRRPRGRPAPSCTPCATTAAAMSGRALTMSGAPVPASASRRATACSASARPLAVRSRR